MKINLNGNWTLSSEKIGTVPLTVPGSVLSALLNNGIIPDPYYRDNAARIVKDYLYDDYSFRRTFKLSKDDLKRTNYLFMDMIDTVASVYVNGVNVANVKDMHLRYRIKLDNSILKEDNEIRIDFTSPYRYIENYPNYNEKYVMFATCEPHFPVIRKCHSMFGWDWGPSLADSGIHRDIYVNSTAFGYLKSFRHYEEFLADGSVKVSVDTDYEKLGDGTITVSFGELRETAELNDKNHFEFLIKNPKLWNPVGFGDHYLYPLTITASDGIETVTDEYKIGLRQVYVDNTEDEIGKNFTLYVNGNKVFMKGASYVPQDLILSRVTKETTYDLLKSCVDNNHNIVRIWGGGYYQDDYFYDICDELGLMVFQDLMFACASYDADDEDFVSLVREEIPDTLRRLRHHASIVMYDGNNECEDCLAGHGEVIADNYYKFSQKIVGPLVEKELSEYFVSSSPTSQEMLVHPNDQDNMDTHYWQVWHGRLPLEAYKTIYPRFLCEYGVQSFNNYDVIKSFTDEKDRTICSEIMTFHMRDYQKNNDKIMEYVRQMFDDTKDLEKASYLSQIMQAEGIKMAAEHVRQNKYRCNGSVYWQLNDIWPGQSWSSFDYYHNPKALHYYSKRFYAPNLISINDVGPGLRINVSNDTPNDMKYHVLYRLYKFDGRIIEEKEFDTEVEKTSDKDVKYLSNTFIHNEDDNPFKLASDLFVYLELRDMDGNVLSTNTYQNLKDKEIKYPKANLEVNIIDEYTMEITTDVFTKYIAIESGENGTKYSDNYFNLRKGERKIVKSSTPIDLKKLTVKSYNNL